jgi:UDPglucose--hexose-1-phosphate uridylyltransferase
LTDQSGQSQLRFDRQTGQWIIVAALRQDRTHIPTLAECPLCPGPSGLTSEVPAPDSDVVVFTSDHTGSFAELEPANARLVVEAWRHRTADLMSRAGVEQVFCFENRGEEIGVTLTHPHGQIYGYSYLTPRTARMLGEARAHRERHGTNLFADVLADEVACGSRLVARNELFTAFVPFAARWPVEVHVYPNRFVRNLIDLDDAELDGFAHMYLDILRRFDRLYPSQLPYISALHQYADTDAQREGYFHVELFSTRRSATKLKYLAGSESAMEAFIMDVTAETVADRLRAL